MLKKVEDLKEKKTKRIKKKPNGFETTEGNFEKAKKPDNDNEDDNDNDNDNEEDDDNKKEEEEIIEFYQNNIALITQYVAEEIAMFLEDGLSKDLIITAMQEAVSRNKRNWKYVSAILEDCLNKKIFTKEAYEISQKEFRQEKEKKPKKKQETIPYQNDFSEYDQYAQKEKKR